MQEQEPTLETSNPCLLLYTHNWLDSSLLQAIAHEIRKRSNVFRKCWMWCIAHIASTIERKAKRGVNATNQWKQNIGLRQGCSISLVLWALFARTGRFCTMIQSIFSLVFIHSTATRRNLPFFGSYKHVNIWYQRLCSRKF